LAQLELHGDCEIVEQKRPRYTSRAGVHVVTLQQTSLPLQALRWLIYGRPLTTQQYKSVQLRKLLALPVFCSDAISSVAYGNQQILLALTMAGLWVPQYSQLFSRDIMVVTGFIFLVLVLASLSYWQTIFAYPGGGGSYIVTKDNLGVGPGLLAASALLIDYVMCVAVSIAAGIQNLRDVPILAPLHIANHMVIYCIGAIVFMVWLNLRGLKDPGALFAIPVYTFIAMCSLMIVLGLGCHQFNWPLHYEYANQTVPPHLGGNITAAAFGVAVLLRAFATGCSALTGIEAVSNGIPAFREPQQKNAAITLMWMAIILGSIFLGVSLLAVKLHIVYWESHGVTAAAVIDQISGTVFGKTGLSSVLYNLMQFSTAFILLVAAQTSFADFPRVTSILARDGFMPRQLSNLGDRLMFDNGIVILGLISALFVIIEKGSVDLLIPFFTIGVFQAFTLSQSGMVRHWFKLKTPGWHVKAFLNGIGAVATFIVCVDIIAEKFLDGAWFVLLVIALMFFVFKSIRRHYDQLEEAVELDGPACSIEPVKNIVLVLVNGVHTGTLNSLAYARSISSDYQAIYVEIEPSCTADFRRRWEQIFPDAPLVILPSPYRSLLQPIMAYLDDMHKEHPEQRITVIIGEYTVQKWWQAFLHGNTALLLKLALLRRSDVVVTNVRYQAKVPVC
jgi:amino acid transporter